MSNFPTEKSPNESFLLMRLHSGNRGCTVSPQGVGSELSRDEYVASLGELDRETRDRLLWTGGLTEYFDEFATGDEAESGLYSALVGSEVRAQMRDLDIEVEYCSTCGRHMLECSLPAYE